MSEHATLLRPSAADRWVRCSASPHLELAHPMPAGPAAELGRQIHALGAELIDLGLRGVLYEKPESVSMRAAPSAEGLTSDQIEMAWVYAQDVVRIAQIFAIFGGQNIGIEQPRHIPAVHQECSGTPDAWIYCERDKTLVLWDLKTGWVPVEAYNSWQLICYAASFIGQLPSDTTVHLIVIQPTQAQPKRVWKTTLNVIKRHADVLKVAANSVMSDPHAHCGKHCRYCSGRLICNALSTEALIAAEYVHNPEAPELTTDQKARELEILEAGAELASYRLEALRTELLTRAQSGEIVPGFRVDHGTGALEWKVPAEDVIAVADAYGVDIRKSAVLTPTQAKKAGLSATAVSSLSQRKPGKAKLVRDDGSEARRIFGGNEE